MKRTTKYVALDVHQAMTVASVREENGRVIARTVVPTEAPALVEFFRGMRGAVHVVFEEGTQAQWLHELVAPLVDRVVVCDQRGRSRHGNKGDQVDADQLSELLRRGGLRAVYHGSPPEAALTELTATYRNLVEDGTRVMLRLKALFRARAIPTRGTQVYQPGARTRWLAQLAERRPVPGRGALRRAQCAASAAAPGEGGDGGRGAAGSGVARVAGDTVPAAPTVTWNRCAWTSEHQSAYGDKLWELSFMGSARQRTSASSAAATSGPRLENTPKSIRYRRAATARHSGARGSWYRGRKD